MYRSYILTMSNTALKQIAFTVDRKGKARAYQLVRSGFTSSFTAGGYFGRMFPMSLKVARELVATGAAEQIPMQYKATPMEGAS